MDLAVDDRYFRSRNGTSDRAVVRADPVVPCKL
ncbi:hypothetical protein C5167_014203 [Papaver somniferum]|uniref:Uncharacterized protein n=1 Tax=Papaver somniferum TaxID=3469 RepID=A0A4Y7J5L5_PAPSO|nr:hypothetical protein C5167_014203 [Papaver somniferum]